MSHYKGSVTINQEGVAPVTAYLFYDGATVHNTEGKGWRGWFNDEDPAGVLREGPASIELLDGRSGNIVIEKMESEVPFGGIFRGDGSEP